MTNATADTLQTAPYTDGMESLRSSICIDGARHELDTYTADNLRLRGSSYVDGAWRTGFRYMLLLEVNSARVQTFFNNKAEAVEEANHAAAAFCSTANRPAGCVLIEDQTCAGASFWQWVAGRPDVVWMEGSWCQMAA